MGRYNSPFDPLSYCRQCSPHQKFLYHLQNKHNFFGVVCEDKNLRLKASKRFKTLYQNPENISNSTSIEQYANDIWEMSKKIINSGNQYIDLDQIISGNLIEVIERKHNIEINEKNKNSYKNWLKLGKN